MRIFNRTSVIIYVNYYPLPPLGFTVVDENYIYNSIYVYSKIGFLNLTTRLGVRIVSNYYTGITAQEIDLPDENRLNSIEIVEVHAQ